jgi:tripartite-type tricarboxylate transporter receptor subunit TctC
MVGSGLEAAAMTTSRRRFLREAGGIAVSLALSRAARAQTYPARPVHIVVGFAAGGGQDMIARLIAQWLSGRLGRPVVVENRPGAGGNIATEAVARAAPDGHTLLLAFPSNAINATLYDNLGFNFIRDIAPVATIAYMPDVLVVHPSVPAASVAELIAYAKANPKKLDMASAGNGTPSHVTGELLKQLAGIDMVHVPYRGMAPALTDLIGGHVHVLFASITASLGYIRAGRLRGLAVTTATRADELPDLPTMKEFVPGFEDSIWYGLGATGGTPPDVVARLNREINGALADATIKARLKALGATVMPGTPAEFGRLIAEETEKWAEVVKRSGAKPD